MRSDAREAAFKIVFAKLFCKEQSGGFAASIYKSAKLSPEEKEFADRLVGCVGEHSEEFQSIISQRVVNYPEYRIYAADRAILLIGLAEIKYFEDIPPLVSVSEAANLARKYSTERSADFVNGVLGGIINE